MIFFFGDIHGYYSEAQTVLSRAVKSCGKPSQIIQVGDLGFGSWQGKTVKWNRKEHSDIPINFIDGNHENFDDLQNYVSENNINHIARGTSLEIDGLRFLFCGGATSHDRHGGYNPYTNQKVKPRIEGYNWWREEKIASADIYRCLDTATPDVIVTHECPLEAFETLGILSDDAQAIDDRKLLQTLLDEFRPKTWIFGHYHEKMDFVVNETHFYCCPQIGPTDFGGSHKTFLKYDKTFEWVSVDKRGKGVSK